MKRLNNTVFLSGLALVLAGCGGGSDTAVTGANGAETESTTSNRAPVAVAGVDVTAFEQRAVTLNADQSSDADGDQLSYFWRQLSGPAVTISSERSETPTLQLPVVTSDAEVLMELEVTDGVSQPSVDQVKVRVLEQPTDNVMSLLPQRSVILADGSLVEVTFNLDVPNGVESGAGLVVNLHWDSKRLAFKMLGDVLEKSHLGLSEPYQDDGDMDNNPRTDQYITVSWVDFEDAQWLSGTTLPLSLFSAKFEPVVGASGSTQVNVIPQSMGLKQSIVTQTVSVEL